MHMHVHSLMMYCMDVRSPHELKHRSGMISSWAESPGLHKKIPSRVACTPTHVHRSSKPVLAPEWCTLYALHRSTDYASSIHYSTPRLRARKHIVFCTLIQSFPGVSKAFKPPCEILRRAAIA